MHKLYTIHNKLPLKERKKVNFFIRMSQCNSNDIKILVAKKNFRNVLNGVFARIRKGNIHAEKCYVDKELKIKEDYFASKSCYRSVETSYKLFLGYYNKNHSKQSVLDYFKCFIEYRYLIFKSINRYIKDNNEFLLKFLKLNSIFPVFLFCPDIEKAVIGGTNQYLNYQDRTYLLTTSTFMNGNESVLTNFKKNIKTFLECYENKEHRSLSNLLLNNSGFNVIWNYQGSERKLSERSFLISNEDDFLIGEFEGSFLDVFKKAIYNI